MVEIAAVRCACTAALRVVSAVRFRVIRMHITLRTELERSISNKVQAGALRAAVAIAERELAVAVVRQSEGSRPRLLRCARHAAPESSADRLLLATLRSPHLTQAAMSVVIGADDYQLLLVEAVAVESSELRAAIRWRLHELIDFPVDAATVDIREILATRQRSDGQTLRVVGVRTAAAQRYISVVGCQIRGFDVIDVPELCLRNLSGLLPQDTNGVALLMLRNGFGQLVLTRQGVLYLARKIELSDRSHHNVADKAGMDDVNISRVALELTRAFKYYESHYGQSPIGDLVIAPDTERARAISVALRGEMGLRVKPLDCREYLDMDANIDLPLDWLLLTAIGAALRGDAPAD
jgi:MSHA biogenesis protein MshI